MDGETELENRINEPNNLSGLGVNSFYADGGSAIGMHADYIADANDHPFARTTFTKDGTGRVRTQSAVGSTSVVDGEDIGAANRLTGKITHYLYGTPTKEELYRLFGNEVGNAAHYKKNAVVDPNGQAHIQYLDASGRVIGTALAGDAPENLLEIDSYPDSFDEITADLTVNNTFDTDGNYVISKKIMVPYTTTYDFVYELEEALDVISPCLLAIKNVKYDLLIYIEDEDFNVVFEHEVPGVTLQSEISWSASFTGPGMYTIHKVLSLNEAHIEQLEMEFYNEQTCADLPENSDPPCNPSCEELCFAAFGFINDDGNRVFEDVDGNYIATEIIDGGITTYVYFEAFDNPTGVALLNDVILPYIADCEANCNKGPSFVGSDPCEAKLNRLKADMSPGGQYFDNTPFGAFAPNDDDVDGWLESADGPTGIFGGIGLVDGPSTTWGTIRSGWQEEWADILVKHHPEYCLYAYTLSLLHILRSR